MLSNMRGNDFPQRPTETHHGPALDHIEGAACEDSRDSKLLPTMPARRRLVENELCLAADPQFVTPVDRVCGGIA